MLTTEQRRRHGALGGLRSAALGTSGGDPTRAREAFNRRFEGEADPAAARVEYFTALSMRAKAARLRKKLAQPKPLPMPTTRPSAKRKKKATPITQAILNRPPTPKRAPARFRKVLGPR
jgi:hypothetical protein